jgi:glutaredoxin 3
MVKRLAGTEHELDIHDMHKREIASKAKHQGIHRVPAVVIAGKLAECCSGSKPDENILRRMVAFAAAP